MTSHFLPFASASLSRRQLLAGTAGLATASVLPLRAWAAGDTLNIRTYAEPDNFDPVDASGFAEEMLYGCIYRKLIQYKPGREWGWQLDLAETIQQVSPTEIAFTLKAGQMWSDGFGEITAADVEFSLERIIDPAMKSAIKLDLGALSGVEVTGTHSGIIKLDKPFAPLWSIALPYLAGTIVCRKAVGPGKRIETAVPPTVAGPYRVVEYRPDDRWVLARNPEFSGPPAAFERVQIISIDDEATAEIAFAAGDIDFTRVSPGAVEHLRKTPPERGALSEHPSLYYVWVGMNMESPKLRDVRVRQAIQHAIDVPSILKAAYFGVAQPSSGLIAPGLTGHREKGLVPPRADLAKARALLSEAGVRSLDLTLDVLNKSTWTTAAQVIQATLGGVGIEVTINVHESGSFWSLGKEADGDRWKKLELVLNRFSMTPDPYYATAWFTTEQVGKWNWERFSNPEFDRLHQEAMAEVDTAKRGAMYRRMQDLMEESGAYRFITHETTPNLYATNLEPALRPDGLPLIQFFNRA
jgi:peptide/nickel transport system substrate-binding protein